MNTEANASATSYYAASLAGPVEAYYPDLKSNPVLELLTKSYEVDVANSAILTAQVINGVIAETDVKTLLTTLTDANPNMTRVCSLMPSRLIGTGSFNQGAQSPGR